MHGLMQQNGYTQDYATFEKGMLGNDHYANRKKVYDLFTQNGADIGATYEEFMQRMQAKPKKQQASKPQTIKDKAAQVNQEYVQGKKPATATTATTSGTDYMKNWQLLTKRNDQLTPAEQAQVSNMRQRMQAANQQQVRKDTKNAITRSRVNPSKMLHEQKEAQYKSASLGADKNNRQKFAGKALDEGMQAYREGRDSGSFAELIWGDSFSGDEAMKARAKQQHEDDARNLAEYEVGGNQFRHNDDKTFGSVGNDIFNIVDSSMNEADALTKQQYLQSLDKIDENNSVGSLRTSLNQQTGAYKDMQTQKQKNRQDALMKNMSAKIQEIYSQKGMQEHIVESANKLNMGIEEYVDKYVTPEIMSYAQKALSIRNKEEIMPHSTLDYIGKNLSTSIVGMIVAPAVLTRDTRQRLQEGIAIADGDAEMEKVMGHKDNTFRSGVGTRFLSTATNMAADAGPLAFIGGGAELAVNTGKSVLTRGLVKAGVMKAGAKLTAEQMAFKVANMTTAQKILSGLGTRAATSSLNLAGYSGITSALNQASTGEDTSLKAIGSAFVNGAEHGAVTGGIFGISGSIMAPWVSKFGINGMETSTGQRMLHGAQKFGATAVGLGVEAGTMMVADNITGDKDISLGTWLEDLVMVGAFKAGEPRNYSNIGRALYGLTHNTSNTFRFGKDANGNARTVDIHMTKDEQNELMNSVSGKNLVEAFQKVDKSSLNSKSPLDKSLTKQAYEDFMNDPNVSQSTKEKVNAAMGLFNTASGRSYRSENDAENKQILEYSKNGTLLTRTSYKTIDERDAILAKQKEMRDNDELISLVGQMRLKDRQFIDENGNITADAFSFMQENGYDINKDVSDPDNAAIISYMKDENSDLYQRWCEFAEQRGWLDDIAYKNARVDTSLKGGIKDVLGIEGMRHNLYSVLAKDPMKRTDMEKQIAKACKDELEARLYPEGKLHAEQSETQGRSIAEDSNLGTEQPNGEAVKAELNNLSEAESELEQFMKDNDVFGQNFEDLQKKGMTNPQIYQWMIENGLTEEQLTPFAHYINANARVQGVQNATQQKIEQKVSLYVQDWSHRGSFNGQDAKGEQVVYVQDKDGRMLVVGSGDMAFDSTNGRAKEGVGDMLVCLDPNKNETVYIKADEVTLFQTQKPEDFGNEYRQKLEQINSVPYNEAAQEQATKDAAKTQQEGVEGAGQAEEKQEGEPSEKQEGKDGQDNHVVDSYKVAKSLQSKVGQSLSEEEASNLTTEMESRAEKPRDIQLTPDSWYAEFGEEGKVVTPLGEVKMGENQVAKLFEKGRSKEFGMIKPTLENPDAIIEVPSSAIDGNEERASSYLFVKTFLGKNGEKVYYFKSVTVKKDGMEISISSHYDRAKRVREALEKGKLLYLKGGGAQTEQNQPSVSGTTSEEVNAGSSAGKDTNNSSNGNGSEATLTFNDGTNVPMTKDSKGRPTPDYNQMTAEQAAEVMTSQLGENADRYVDAQIKKAEKAVKDAEKMKIDFNGEPNDIIEQQSVKDATIAAAKEQLQKAQDVKKAMTEQKIKNTLEAKKAEEPSSNEGEPNAASSSVAEKFQSSTRLQGRTRTRTLSDGTKVSGHYEIVPAESLTPSHDVFNGYKKSEGFPVDAEGRTINDRDYEHDQKAQEDTELTARKYDGQAIDHIPTISDEGIVYDGNGRTMAGQKAAKDGTDGEYMDALYENAEMYGFTREQIEQSGIEHPRLVMVTDERLPYDTETFAKFNRNEKKTQSNTEKAVVRAKTLSSDEIGSIVAEVEGSGSLEAFFKNPKAINDLINTLQDKGILAHNEIAELMDGEGKLSAQGEDYVKNLLLGSVFTPDTIRMMGIDSAIKTKAVAGIRAIMDNMKLGDYSLRGEIDNAVKLLYEARNNNMTVDDLLRQSNAFDENARDRFSPIEQAIAQSLEGRGTTMFRDLMREYNDIAKNHNTGEGDMFGGNLAPDELVKQFLGVSKTIKENDIKLYGNETERRNSEQEGGNHAASNEESAKEARGAAGTEAESQQQVDEAVKSIATEITKGTGVEVVTGEKAQEALDEAEAWGDDIKYQTSGEIDKQYPNWLDGTTNDNGKHSTQVAGTIGTYKKVAAWVESHLGKGVKILDASSGMGLGTKELREQGFNIEDVEPYQSEDRKENNPATYSSYGDIKGKYDFIISNAVLNVIPDDWRTNVLHDMANRLSDGGRLFINTRKAGEEKSIKDKIELDSPQEVLVKRNGKIASYQRFFTPKELKDWVEKELGDGYEVEVANEKNSGTKGLAAVVVTKRKSPETVAPLSKDSVRASVVSGDSVAKVQKNLDETKSYYEKSPNKTRGFITDVSKSLGLTQHEASQYGTFVTKDGKRFTLRISNHNTRATTFDENGENEGVSIVISRGRNNGIRDKENTRAHVVEFFYPKKAIERAEGKPLVSIIESIKETLDTGIYKDKTGLAKPDEVDGTTRKEFRSKNGEVYGFTDGEKIYLDTKKMKPETPLHEYTHLWTESLKRGNPKEWENVKKLFDEVEGLKEEVQKLYPELKGDDLYEEMITTYSGREGAKKLEDVVRELAAKEGKTVTESAKAQSFLDKVKTALQKYWKGVADMLHIHFTTAEEVADKVLADWAKGVNPKDIKGAEEKDDFYDIFDDGTKDPEDDKKGEGKDKVTRSESYRKFRDLLYDYQDDARTFPKEAVEEELKRVLKGLTKEELDEAYKGLVEHGKEHGGLDTIKVISLVKSEIDRRTSDPMEGLTKAAERYHIEKQEKISFKQRLQLGIAHDHYEKAKKSGNAERVAKAAKEYKQALDDVMKSEGKPLAVRQQEIAKFVGKEEAEKIDKPWAEMDGEERMFTAEKNPLTEDEIRNNVSEENQDLIEDAIDYLNGNHGFAQQLAYLKIYEDVRRGHENAAGDSRAEDGTQLAPSDNGGSEGLELGTGRESRGTSGQLDRGTGGETAPGEQPSGENSEGQSGTPVGERGNSEGEGDASRLGGLSAGDTESKGSGNDDSNGATLRHDKGRRGSNRPSKTNARRKPAAKQGTTWRNRTEAEIKQEAKDAKAGLKAALAEMMKRGRGDASLSLVGLNSKQIEYVPELMKAVKRYGMSLIDQGIYKIKDWMNNIREGIHDDMKAIGFSDKDIDDFIEEMWNSKMTMDGETHTISEWSSIYGNAQLRKKLGDELDIKRQKQMDAEPIKVKIGDRKNIEETLPFLLPQQQEDVYRAETQFFGKEHSDRTHAYGKGYMFTNGTGTGKTYTGLGIAKRLAKQGKGRILFVTPSQPKVKDWIKDGKNLGLEIHDLDSVAKEKGTTATTESGEGMVITTYANMRQNKKLLETEWDAVIYDESHRIMENKKGAETTGSQQHYMLTNRDEKHTFMRLQTINKDYQKMVSSVDKFNEQRKKEIARIEKEYRQNHPEATMRDVAYATNKAKPKDIYSFTPADGNTFPKLGKAYQDFRKATEHYHKNVEPKLKEQAKQTWKNTKTIFLSATPFNTRENLDYAEGYIFKYPEDNGNERMNPRSRFYLDHFGAAYRYRYNRLESKADNPDAIAKQEVAFSDYLQNELGTMSGRIIDSPYDYSRDFPTVAPDHAEEFNAATQEALTGRYLGEAYHKTIGNYNYGSALFETMKIANIIDRMKEHIAAGRKIVVFHRRVETKEPLQAPFAYMLSYANEMIKEMRPGKEKEEAIAEANEFRRKYADLLQWEQTLDYSMPREQIAKAFGEDNVLFFSGKESSKVKNKAVETFNDDNSGKNIIVIQEASGKEGISLHDTTGQHQRVCITLALPQSPITALQIEGRTYRIGNKSNAIFEYPILGLNTEMMLFGEKFNNQVSTTENLALGSQARSLRESFAKGVLEHSGVVPIDQQGVGGKEFDAPKESSSDPFDDAVLDYYSNQKLNKRNREGIDYFPTPEPLGYKMVEWANMGEGDTALEPSAGHGAIARYVPKENQLLSIEPSQSLFTKLQLKAGGLGRKFLNNTFENYDVSNKHDVVVMNPPFGTAGATAIAHLDKAFKHLDEGGRVVAIIPRGSTDKKFDKWIDGQKNVAMRAEVNLPDIVFQQAGTSVRCRVVVLDKITDAAMRAKAGDIERIDLSGHYDKIEDFFEDLRDVQMPDRIIDTQLKDMKKARTFKKDLESIKGVSVSIEKRGISVFDKNRYNDYSIAFPEGNMSKEWLTEHYSKKYQEFSAEQERAYNENSKAALDEMKKLTCKLADMSEDEMQKYIEDKKNGGSEGKVHFRTEDNDENKDGSDELFLSLQQKSNNKTEYNETVTELARREAEKESSSKGTSPENNKEQGISEGNARRDGEGGHEDVGIVPSAIRIIAQDRRRTLEGNRTEIGDRTTGERTGDFLSHVGSKGYYGKDEKIRDEIDNRILDWAKDNGFYVSEDEVKRKSYDGRVFGMGSEARVYLSNDRTKVTKFVKYTQLGRSDMGDYVNFVEKYNSIFPETSYRIVGVSRDASGIARVVVEQPYIDGQSISFKEWGENQEKYENMVEQLMQQKGFAPEGDGLSFFNNDTYVTDVHYRNILFKDGKPIIVDANIRPRSEMEDKDNDRLNNQVGDWEHAVEDLKDYRKTANEQEWAEIDKLLEELGKKVTSAKSSQNNEAHYRVADASVKVSDKAPEVVKHIDSVAQKTGSKVNMVHSVEEIINQKAKAAVEEGKPVTGWYDEATGEVHLYMPNIHDSYTAEKTIWHEVVGHKGMRELFGADNYDKFLRSLWYDLDKPENAALKKLVDEERKKNPLNIYDAIEEGVARLAEEGKGEPGFWNNIKNKVVDFLHELGYKMYPNTKDVKYLLWLSKNLQKNPNDPYYKMRAEAVKYRLDHEEVPAVIHSNGMFYENDGKTHTLESMPKTEYQEATDGRVHFRTTPSAGTALDRYDRALNAHGYMATESFMDNMLSLKELMKAVDPSIKKIEDVKSSENPYMLQNTMQGAMSDAAQMFERNVMKPLDKAMADVLDAFEGKKDNDKIRNFNLYMITKHGLERNRVFFVRDYIGGMEKADAGILQKQWDAEKKDLGDKLRKGQIRLDEYYKDMDEWIRNNVDKDFDASEHDYSGMHGVQEIADTKAPYDDAAAIQSVMDSEASMESTKAGSVKDFWSKVNKATSYSLYCDYANGFQNRETYTKTSQMFDWYVPLRKFDETTAEDVYGYVTEKGDPSGYIGSVLMSAKGRKSLSEANVLAQIGAMGNMAISNGGKNAIKQAFMRFARSHDSQGLITEGQVWLVKDGTNADGSDRWVEAYPQIPEGAAPKTVSNIVRQFEADMEAKQATGDAKIMRNAAEIGYKFQRAADKSQHVVDVKVNGKTHRFYINGNPRAAQALNGMLESKGSKYLKPLSSITRTMAQLCTSYSPEFVVRNIVRDAQFASSNVTAKEGARYGAKWGKYYAKMLPIGAKNISIGDIKGSTGLGLYAKYRNGTLDMNNKIHKYFKEFMENGGETGWVQVLSMKEWEKKYKRDIKTERSKLDKGGKAIKDFFFGNLENLNEAAENMARFATYCTSRDYGRSAVRSAYDAKEVSTNFNRHGSGDSVRSFKNGEMSGFEKARRNTYGFVASYLRQCSMFFNAGIQSTNLLKQNVKAAPKGTLTAMMGTPFALGALAALVNNWMIANEDEKERNGVKDPYAELPDYIRRNDLCIYKGGGEFITIPLAIELRAFYGLGDLAAGMTFADNIKSTRKPWMDAVGCVSQLVPVMDYTNSHAVDKNPGKETLKAILPSSLSPFAEWGLNSDWKGAPIRRETTSYNEYAPAWQRAYKNTPEFFMQLNKKVNAATNDIAPGNEDMLGNGFLDAVTNPAGLNHYIGGFGGGAATFATRISKLATADKTETNDVPFLRSFLYKPNEQSSMQRTKSKWYNYVEGMEKTMSNLDRLKSKNVPIDKRLENIGAYYKFRDSKEAQAADIIERAQKYMKKWKQMRDKSSDATAIDNANQNIDLIMQQAVEQLDKLQ